MAVMWPLATHPQNKNEVIAWDLAEDPAVLATMNVEEIRLRLFSKRDDLPEGVTRLPLKGVHLNKSPMVVGNLKTLTAAQAQHWGIDMDAALRHAVTARDLLFTTLSRTSATIWTYGAKARAKKYGRVSHAKAGFSALTASRLSMPSNHSGSIFAHGGADDMAATHIMVR